MLTEKQFLYAEKISADNLYNVSEMSDEHSFFFKNSLIEPIHIRKNNATYVGYKLSSRGQELYEEYKRMRKDETRKDKTLKIAEEANLIAKEANKKSDKSNRIAIGSLFAAIISVIVAIVAIIFAA